MGDRKVGAAEEKESELNKKKHLKTCPHCAFLQASRRQYKKHGGEKAKVEAINSAAKIVSVLFQIMTPEAQTEFIKEVTAPRPDISNVMEAVKAAIEALGGGKVKVTEH